MKNSILLSLFLLTICSFTLKVNNSTSKTKSAPTVWCKASELIFASGHSPAKLRQHDSYAIVSKLTNEQLKEACWYPANGDYITLKRNTKIILQGNTRVLVLMERGLGNYIVPCDEHGDSPSEMKSWGFYDM